MGTSVPKRQCDAAVSEPPHYLHEHRCSRAARVNTPEGHFCDQHARKLASHGFIRVYRG